MAKRRAHGEGSIYQIADGTWRGSVQIGEGRRKYVRGTTRTEVVRQIVELRARIEEGRPALDGRVRVGQFLAQWLEDSARPSVRASTYRSYAMHLRLYLVPELGNVKLAELTPGHVQRLMNRMVASGLSPTTAVRVHATLRRALGEAERWGLVSRNVAKLVNMPKQERHEIEPFTPDEARTLLAAVKGHRLEALYAVAVAMGLRQGEALGLRWQDVDLDARSIRIRHQLQRRATGDDVIPLLTNRSLVPTKTHRSRRALVVPATLAAQLRAHRARQARERLLAGADWMEHDLVFTTRRGGPIDARNLLRDYKALLRSADLPDRRFHDLRHSCGSFLAAQGVPLVEIQTILGHAQISTTMVYVHSLSESMHRAADQMDQMLWGNQDQATGAG